MSDPFSYSIWHKMKDPQLQLLVFRTAVTDKPSFCSRLREFPLFGWRGEMLLRGSWGPSPVSSPTAGSRPVCFWMPPEDAASDRLAAVLLLVGKVMLQLGAVRPTHCVCCLPSSHRHYGTRPQDVNARGSQLDWGTLPQNEGLSSSYLV